MLVGAGGFIGAICRYGMSGVVQRHASLSAFPYGTLTVNLAQAIECQVAKAAAQAVPDDQRAGENGGGRRHAQGNRQIDAAVKSQTL